MTNPDPFETETGGNTPRKARVVVLGEFSAGKSTLINLMTGSRSLRTQVTATQMPPVWISYGDAAAYRVDLSGAKHPIDTGGFETIPVSETACIRMFMISPFLQLCDIIDTPGNSDPNIASEAWERVAKLADVAIWCSPATQAWRKSELSAWQDVPEQVRARSILLLTRADKLTSEQDREKVLRRVRHEAGDLFTHIHMTSLLDFSNAREILMDLASLCELPDPAEDIENGLAGDDTTTVGTTSLPDTGLTEENASDADVFDAGGFDETAFDAEAFEEEFSEPDAFDTKPFEAKPIPEEWLAEHALDTMQYRATSGTPDAHYAGKITGPDPVATAEEVFSGQALSEADIDSDLAAIADSHAASDDTDDILAAFADLDLDIPRDIPAAEPERNRHAPDEEIVESAPKMTPDTNINTESVTEEDADADMGAFMAMDADPVYSHASVEEDDPETHTAGTYVKDTDQNYASGLWTTMVSDIPEDDPDAYALAFDMFLEQIDREIAELKASNAMKAAG